MSQLVIEAIRAGDVSKLKEQLKSLTHLLLWGIQIETKGAKCLAEALKSNQSLIELNLGSNRIGDEGAKYLAGALTSNRSLTELDLVFNRIGDEGAKHLAKALKLNRSLTDLNLGGNHIGNRIGDHVIHDEIMKLIERNQHNYSQRTMSLQRRGWLLIKDDPDQKSKLPAIVVGNLESEDSEVYSTIYF